MHSHHAFIIPHFNYCSETWQFYSKNATARLEIANKRVLRFVFNEKQTPYCELIERIGLPSLVNQHLAKIVYTVFNIINNEHAPKSMKEPVRVEGGMSLRNDMWHDLRNGIIMTDESNLCRMTISYAASEIFEEFQWKAYSNVLKI